MTCLSCNAPWTGKVDPIICTVPGSPGLPRQAQSFSPESPKSSSPKIQCSPPPGIIHQTQQVWSWNFEKEVDAFLSVATYLGANALITLHAEFPGFMCKHAPSADLATRYKALRDNVNLLKPIQISFAVADIDGTLHGEWNFNLLFNIEFDLHMEASVQSLQATGVNFPQHAAEGVSPQELGQRLSNSCLIGAHANTPSWITFCGLYDLAHFMKILSDNPLPSLLPSYNDILAITLPRLFELSSRLPLRSSVGLARMNDIGIGAGTGALSVDARAGAGYDGVGSGCAASMAAPLNVQLNAQLNASTTQCPAQMPFAYLGRPIASRLIEVAPSADNSARADRCLSALRSMMECLGPQWDLEAFGSFANGFGTVRSDLDVTCCHRGFLLESDVQRTAASDLKTLMVPMLREHSSFCIDEEILGARVPILKLRFENVLDVDLSCHNPIPVYNTRLLKAYSLMDARIKDVVLTIKLWAKRSGVCDAAKRHLSSYSFTLLVIYFLQVHPEAQLPILPVDAFEGGAKQERDERVMTAMAGWQCSLSLPELVARFFAFYSGTEPNAFCWGSEVVSVRCGHRSTARDSAFSQLRGRHSWRLHIEDPYLVKRNLHVVLGEFEEELLRNAFSDTWQDIQSNRVPVALHSGDSSDQPFVRAMGCCSSERTVNSDALATLDLFFHVADVADHLPTPMAGQDVTEQLLDPMATLEASLSEAPSATWCTSARCAMLISLGDLRRMRDIGLPGSLRRASSDALPKLEPFFSVATAAVIIAAAAVLPVPVDEASSAPTGVKVVTKKAGSMAPFEAYLSAAPSASWGASARCTMLSGSIE